MLTLTIKKQWFDMIVSGVKKEELSIIRTKGNRDIDEIEIIMDNAIDD